MKTTTFLKILSGVLIIMMSLQLSAQVTLNLKVFLEGPFNGSSMNTTLNAQNLIPLTQPYNIAPWNYTGAEQVGSIPNPNIVDWVLIELRETTGDASTATPNKMINRQAAFIRSDGSIVGTDGSNMIGYAGTIISNLYVIIWHRNHLSIMSSGPLSESGGIYSWDFTDQLSKVHLNGQKQIGTGFFGMIAGDCDGNGRVFTRDKRLEWYSEGGEYGYFQSDLNLDCQVENNDKDDYWEPNFGLTTKIPTDLSWECFMDFTDARDGQVYSTVEIGSQCWMAENLNIGTMIQGNTDMADNSIIEKYCYNNTAANCDVYGGLYQWNEMIQYVSIPGLQGICPADWHIPTDMEWTILTDLLGGANVAGGKMKESGAIHWNSPNTGASNESGFTGLPGGLRTISGTFFNQMGSYSNIWSSTDEGVTSNAWRRSLEYSTTSVVRYQVNKLYGLSVRCVRDNQPPTIPSNPQPSNGAINQPINTTLAWNCNDPENDPLTYDVYFGISNPPSLVSPVQTGATYNPGTLAYSTPYYWKIVAHDDHSNSTEGAIWTFTTMSAPSWQCGDPMTDVRDNQTYNTVQIGTQCWMAENLNIGTMVPGTTEMTNNSIIEKYCYENNIAKCDVYGGLYQWNEMMEYSTSPGVQGICPATWHLPTDAAWTILTAFLGGEGIAGGKMKTTGTIEAGTGLWYAPNTGATNESGFTTLPGGYRSGNSSFNYLGSYSEFWSSTVYLTAFAWSRNLGYISTAITGPYAYKYYGYSVRCVKD